MSTIFGNWYPPLSSSQSAAMLSVEEQNFTLFVNDEEQLSGSIHELSVSDRTGNIQRRVTFPDNSLFETGNNEAIDKILSQHEHNSNKRSVLHKLESSWGWVLVGIAALIIAPIVFFKWGLPAVAKKVAYSMPPSVHETVSTGTLKFLDKVLLDPTELSEDDQAKVQSRFDEILATMDKEGFEFKLHFRKLGVPNAFALPSGDIVVTDALVEIADPIEEVVAVLFHEIGHVLERHGLQQVIQASTITVIASLVIGDVSGIGELATSMPVFLMQSSYSRQAESSADLFAFREMTKQGIDPTHFATIMAKFSKIVGDDDDENTDYLASHPLSLERADKAREYSEQHFKNR